VEEQDLAKQGSKATGLIALLSFPAEVCRIHQIFVPIASSQVDPAGFFRMLRVMAAFSSFNTVGSVIVAVG